MNGFEASTFLTPHNERQKQVMLTQTGTTKSSVVTWSSDDVEQWLRSIGLSDYVERFCKQNGIDGLTLLLIKEDDLKQPPLSVERLCDIKKLWYNIRRLQCTQNDFYSPLSISTPLKSNMNESDENINLSSSPSGRSDRQDLSAKHNHSILSPTHLLDSNAHNAYSSCRVHANRQPVWSARGEKRKTLVSFLYALGSAIWTSFIMVVVHNRVPNVQKYPPLPDLFLDNIPHIAWAFTASEYLVVIMGSVFLLILIFHKHWSIILRRFFALGGTIFFLRSITMLVTSLSVPGHHLDCTPLKFGSIQEQFSRWLQIFLFQGLSIHGVRSCGDYMFSGHTVMLTLLNHCITEYTTSDFYVLHLISWLCNILGMILILAAHEHYTIDVFIAFFLTSRLFLYYHSLANNAVLHNSRTDTRLSIWFPMFSYFEKNIQCMIPNVLRIPWPLTFIYTPDDNQEEKDECDNDNHNCIHRRKQK